MDTTERRPDSQLGDSDTDDDIDPRAFEFYPGGKHTRWFLDAPICPGQTEPYVLPPNIDLCPIEGCPAFRSKRKFKPHWRLNEHMKTRHGWPRRSNGSWSTGAAEPSSERTSRHIQPHRESTASRDFALRSNSKRKHADDNTVNSPSVLSTPVAEASPGRPTRTRRQTAKGKEMANSIARLDAATSRRASKRSRVSDNAPIDTISDAESSFHDAVVEPGPGDAVTVTNESFDKDSVMDVDSPRSSPKKSVVEDTLDREIITAIKSLAGELRLASGQNPELAHAAKEYEELVENGLIRVNCTVNEQTASALASCYQRLAERHNARAMVFSMHTSLQPPAEHAPPRPVQHVPYEQSQAQYPIQPVPYQQAPAPRLIQPMPHEHSQPPNGSAPRPLKPLPSKEFRFINDAPRSKEPKVNGFTAINGRMEDPTSSGTPVDSTKPNGPIMLKLKLQKNKGQAA
ncbi:MAG: hypothetical protein Q9162_000297 [Coniocarpon cinnabarinum]